MAGGLWARKFDHKNGEDRVCKICDTKFHAHKPVWRCQSCINAAQRIIEEKKRAQYEKKDTYPFNNRTSEANNRFCKIRTQLSNAWKEYYKTGDRSVITQHYDKQLKEIAENGILTWILDRRSVDALKENKPFLKSDNMINKELPDTRGWYEE